MLTHGSLFSGIGGFDLGFERAGIETIWQVENYSKAVGVLERHYPNTKRYGDITNVESVGRPDIITAGFPCQDLSVAGKRAGLAGERSGLFWEVIRITRKVLPTWILLENVSGLFSSNDGRDMGIILSALGELGYGVAWRRFNSRYFGVPQRRPRVFIVGHFGAVCPGEILFEPESLSGNIEAGEETGENYQTGSLAARDRGGGGLGTDFDVDGGLVLAYAIRANPSRSCDKGDGGVNQTLVAVARESGPGYWMGDNISGPIRAEGENRLSRASHLIAHCLKGRGCDAGEDGTGRGTPLVTAELTPTLREAFRTGNFDGVADKVGVRRLTPRECERLQGFPDDWTRWDSEGNEIADTPRYKMLGNAVTVPVAEWIGRRIIEVNANPSPTEVPRG